ncbi:MAG: thiolase C-terminal domain-containing protein [Desertimonas sp.]
MKSTLRGAAAIVGIGETPYYKRGTSPDSEVKQAVKAIVAACEDAGISPMDVDGFVSYGSERNDGQRLLRALGAKELRFGALMWTHGGGIPGAVGLAAMAVATGQAECVAVYRSMAEQSHTRLRVAVAQNDTAAQYLVNGLDGPMQICALRSMRLFEAEGVPRSAMKAMVLASYHHAKNNPHAYGRTTEIDADLYEESRWVAEPYRLFDCSRENDAACAVLVVPAERAQDFADRPAYVLSAPAGIDNAWGGAVEEQHSPYWSSGFSSVARRLWAESGYGPGDVDVAQIYENSAGMGLAAMIDHGLCSLDNAGEFLTLENLIAPNGKLPINTAGGNLAEGFLHGMGLVAESARQIFGTSTNQVPDAELSLMTGGPGDTVVSSLLLGSDATR